MSKSRRVFLSIPNSDDFWGNGDRIEDEKKSKQSENRIVEEDDEDGMEDKYFFKQSKLAREKGQKKGADEEGEEEQREPSRFKQQPCQDDSWNYLLEEEKKEVKEVARPLIGFGGKNPFLVEPPMPPPPKPTLRPPPPPPPPKSLTKIDLNEAVYNHYRKFFKNRPEVLFLVRCLHENGDDNYDNKFIDLYEKTRKKLETFPNPQISQVLRRTCNSHLPTIPEHSRPRNKNAVVVSNFREPDRRLGRYSKYYYHHNVGPEVYSRKVFVGGLPACVTENDILGFFSRYGRLHVDWPSKHYGCKSDSDPSLCNEPISSSSSTPTSHLSMASPPFGQINPFMSSFDYSSPPKRDSSPMSGGGFARSSGCGGSGGGCLAAFSTPFGGNDGSIGDKRQSHLGYVFLLFEKERSVRDLVAECFEEEEGLFITLETSIEPIRVQIRPWLLADAEFLMDFNVPINTKLVAFIGGVPRPLKAVELAHFFQQTYGNVVCVGIDIDNKFKYPRGSGRVAFSNYDAYVQAITDRYIILDHEDVHKRTVDLQVEIKPYFFHNQSCEECSGRYNRQHAPYFCPSLECFQYYCEPCWHKMHSHPSRVHHMPVVKGI